MLNLDDPAILLNMKIWPEYIILTLSSRQEHNVQVRLTGKEDWGAVPGERIATISGKTPEQVSGAMKDLLDIIVKDPDSSLNKSLVYPSYPMYDMYNYYGGVPPHPQRSHAGGNYQGSRLVRGGGSNRLVFVFE